MSATAKRTNGLLGRAMSIDNKKKSNTVQKQSKPPAHAGVAKPSLTQKLTNLPTGLQFPGHFLSILSQEYGFKKCGIFLLEEPGDYYSAAALYGFDTTTCNRIRIPGSLFSNSSLDQQIVKISALLRKRLQPFLSTREFGLLEKGAFILLQRNGHFQGVILLSEEDWKAGENTYSDVAKLCLRYQEKLLQSRPKGLIKPAEKMEIYDSTSEIEVMFNQQIESENCLRFLFVDVESVLQFLKDRNEFSPSIQRSINEILRSLCVSNDNFIRLSPNQALLILKGRLATTRSDLIIHQIQISLASFFKNPEGFPKIKWEIRDYPEHGKTFEELLKPLLSN